MTDILTFGKHKGKPLSEVPDNYLTWMAEYHTDDAWRDAAEAELERRGIQGDDGDEFEDEYVGEGDAEPPDKFSRGNLKQHLDAMNNRQRKPVAEPVRRQSKKTAPRSVPPIKKVQKQPGKFKVFRLGDEFEDEDADLRDGIEIASSAVDTASFYLIRRYLNVRDGWSEPPGFYTWLELLGGVVMKYGQQVGDYGWRYDDFDVLFIILSPNNSRIPRPVMVGVGPLTDPEPDWLADVKDELEGELTD